MDSVECMNRNMMVNKWPLKKSKLIKKIFNMLDTQMIKNKIKKFLKNPIQKIDNQEQEEEKKYVKEVKVNQTGELLKTI